VVAMAGLAVRGDVWHEFVCGLLALASSCERLD
jgi:hypothetical protein